MPMLRVLAYMSVRSAYRPGHGLAGQPRAERGLASLWQTGRMPVATDSFSDWVITFGNWYNAWKDMVAERFSDVANPW